MAVYGSLWGLMLDYTCCEDKISPSDHSDSRKQMEWMYSLSLRERGLYSILWFSFNISPAILLSVLPCVSVPGISSLPECHSTAPSSPRSLTNNLLCCHVVNQRNSSTWHATLLLCSALHTEHRDEILLCPFGPVFIKTLQGERRCKQRDKRRKASFILIFHKI